MGSLGRLLQEKSRSFPPAISHEVEDGTPSRAELMGEAQGRMTSYVQTCRLNLQTDCDSGAASFTPSKSVAEGLYGCGLNTESIKGAADAMADCPTNQMPGPWGVLGNVYLQCKACSVNPKDYKREDGKPDD